MVSMARKKRLQVAHLSFPIQTGPMSCTRTMVSESIYERFKDNNYGGFAADDVNIRTIVSQTGNCCEKKIRRWCIVQTPRIKSNHLRAWSSSALK
jgi:hypothetical protein